MTTYEVNANDRRHFASSKPAEVASVAATWLRQGHEPELYAIRERDGLIETAMIEITTARETAARLRAK